MLWKIIQVVVLFINGVAILNEERFLRRIGFGYRPQLAVHESFKARIVNLLHAVRTLLRLPLILVNISMIFLAFILG